MSLLATVEIVKVINAYIIGSDPDMYTKKYPVQTIVNTCTIIEDLGSINFIFSDKTGTLTRNEMVLKELSFGQNRYVLDESFQTFISNESSSIQNVDTKLFFTNLLICNSVIVEKMEGQERIYQSSSPDEAAIVIAINSFGFKFIERLQNGVNIEYLGEPQSWDILLTLEFTSERKRMSVIAKSPDGKFYLFTKGADECIYERLEKTDMFSDATNLSLDYFAKKGLRTLCIAYREINKDEVERALSMIDISNISSEKRKSIILSDMSFLEENLKILGCTGIEDRLQDNVCKTISILRDARIKLWMLTGDKQETATNIGFSCHLLESTMQLFTLSSGSTTECRQKLENILEMQNIVCSTKNMVKNPKRCQNIALILTGNDLKYVLSKECLNSFLNLAVYCKTVICCRVSASQKKEILVTVKNGVSDTVTLAIGDGANDCNMIRSAHVGVGILGKEGIIAANTADFAIDEFQLLSRLLFVHGASCYRKISNCVYFTFYKNIIINFVSFFFNIITLFSGNSFIHKLHFSLYNNLYSILHPFCFGILDIISSDLASQRVPYLYRSIRKSYAFGIRRFLLWFSNSILHSFLICVLCYFSMVHGTFGVHGVPMSDSFFKTIILSTILLVITLKSVLELRNWSWATQVCLWIGYVSFIPAVLVLSQFPKHGIGKIPELLSVDIQLFGSPIFYFSFTIPFIILFPDFIYLAYFFDDSKHTEHVVYSIAPIY
ncbi:Phospholipid-transporting ATPase IB [Thelohanellus kitauei]|uniref:Phospholipid-transporting ATPase n=1 Tax=Thelohanellus kitauei TaxID=669202 RepID=A0A0C2M161_THEKT|nr:Phospholipid-transporting ATPase IB [Thelohanellus kitauei]